MDATVLAVHAGARHSFSKPTRRVIRLLEGLGVEGDAHCGATVKHRGRLPRDAQKPNLRQIHLIHAELFEYLGGLGFDVQPGDMGENITTTGLDLLALPTSSRLALGESSVVELTGLRNPCKQLDLLAPGLMQACVRRPPDGELVRLAGVMGVVIASGELRAGERITVERPATNVRLRPV